jgi:hypothetical protein
MIELSKAQGGEKTLFNPVSRWAGCGQFFLTSLLSFLYIQLMHEACSYHFTSG